MSQNIVQNHNASCNARVAKKTIQAIYEKMGLRAFEGYSECVEEWVSPAKLLLTGTMEMESADGTLLTVPFSCPISFGEYSLDLRNVKAIGIHLV